MPLLFTCVAFSAGPTHNVFGPRLPLSPRPRRSLVPSPGVALDHPWPARGCASEPDDLVNRDVARTLRSERSAYAIPPGRDHSESAMPGAIELATFFRHEVRVGCFRASDSRKR